MSYASYNTQDAPRRHKSERHRERRSRRDRPVEYQETTYVEQRDGPPRSSRQMELIRRPREDSDDYIEEVQRDFPPGDGAYGQRRSTVRNQYAPRRARSADRGRYDDDYYSGGDRRGSRKNRHYDEKDRSSRKGGRRGYDDYSDSESSVSPRRRDKRRKSLGEQALAAVGLGGLAGAASGGGRSQSRSGRRRRYSSSPRSRSRTPERSAKIQQAVQAALTAGAVEAFRARKEPGGWGGEKGKRVLTAAIGAGGIDGLVDRDPNKKSTLHTVEAVIGGLAGNRLVNGPRDRSQSRGRGGGGGGGGGLKDLAAGGLAAAAGKALLDHRNRSKSRNRRRSYSSSSEDSRSPPRNRTRNRNQRSKSVSGFIDKGIDKGLAALGLRESENHREEYRDQQGSRRSDGYDDGYSQPRSMPREEVARMRGCGGEVKRGSSGSSSSDDMSSAEEDRTRKKMRGKEFLTAGLAAVATIHAGHEVYESYEAAQKRHKEVKEGTMSPQEARKMKSKAAFQDVAAVGIAALGIKSAVGEWKEMKEKRDECHEFEHKRDEKKKKRSQNGSQNGSQNSRPSYNGSNASYRSSAPNLYSSYQNGNMNGYGGRGPMYQDGNPYATGGLPPPPMGAPPARY